MARFDDLGLGVGWWFFFQLKIASGDVEFKEEFMGEVMRLFLMNGSTDVIDKNDKTKERVSVCRLRRKIP